MSAGEVSTLPGPVDAYELLHARPAPPRWAIEGWWTEGAQGVIAGLPKSHKSQLGLELAWSLATGEPFLGEVPVLSDPAPVLAVHEEMTPNGLAWYLEGMWSSRGHLLEWRDETRPPITDGWLDDPARRGRLDLLVREGATLLGEEWEALRSLVEAGGYRYVVLDSLYALAPGLDLNDAKEVAPVLQRLTRLKETAGCSAILVHHANKASRYGPGSLLGSVLLRAWYESAVFTEKRSSGLLHVTGEHRDAETPPAKFLAFDGPGRWTLVPDEQVLDETGKVHTGKAKKVMRLAAFVSWWGEHPEVHDLTQEEIVEACPYVESQATLSRYLRDVRRRDEE